MQTLGAQISHMLKSRGVRVVFGIPGVHNQELYRGLGEAGLRHVLARHEQGAGFMADGYARASGQPGVAFVISGPGLTNILTPMGQAYSDSVPMLVISSCLDDTAATRGQLHQMRDQEGAARCVADWSETARSAEAAYALIDRALTAFQTARPRPCHMQVPIGVLAAPAPAAPPAAAWPVSSADAADPLRLEPLRAALRGAARPLFIFGGGAVRNRALDPRHDPLPALLRRLGAASFATYAGRGRIPGDDPLHFGTLLARPDSAQVIASADLVVAVGTELSETDLWRDALGHAGNLVRIDLDPAVLADRHRADMPVHAGADAHLLAALAELEDMPAKTGWRAAEVAAFRAAMRAQIDAERPGILPVVDALRAALPPETMVFSDMTQFAYAALEVWEAPRPNLWHHPSGFGTLGYALPAAIGGKIARPDAPVIAVAGDYGFQYTLPELAVAVELGLTLPIFLWDNGKLGEIEDGMVRAQIAPTAVVQRNPDFGLLARAYGAAAAQPRTLAEMHDALRAALAHPGPTLIRVDSRIARP